MNSFALKRSVWLQKTLSSCLSIRSRPVPTVVMLWACYVSTLMLCKRRKPQTRQCTPIFLSFFLLFPHIFRVASPGAQGAGWGCKGRAIQRPQGAPHKWRAEMDPCRWFQEGKTQGKQHLHPNESLQMDFGFGVAAPPPLSPLLGSPIRALETRNNFQTL